MIDMATDYDLDLAGDFVLALMAFEIHDGGRAWKGYPWEVLAHLYGKGLISDPRTKAKSVVLSDDGEARARAERERLRLGAPRLTSATGAPKALSKDGGLPDIQRRQVETLMEPICVPPQDPKVRSQVKVGFRIERLSVILFESRPSFMPPHDWQEEPIAKFTYVKSGGFWKLFCMLRDLKWHGYEPFRESQDLASLVSEVRTDPTGIFWG